MKKEVLIAILIGFGLGLIITYGLYRMRSSFMQPPTQVATLPVEENAGGEETASVLALHKPDAGTVQTENTTTVTGTTFPESFVVLFINEDDVIVETDETGNFSYEATLTAGTNVIRAHAVSPEGETYTVERVVVVTDIFTQSPATDSATTDTETEEDA